MLLLHIWDRNPTTELRENFLGSTSHGYSIAPALRPEGNSAVPWTDPAVYTQNQEFQSTALFPRPLPTHLLGFKPQEGGMSTFLCRRMGCKEPSACSTYSPCSHLRAPECLAASEGTRTALNASFTPSCQDQTKLPGGRSFEIASPWPAWHQGAVSCPLRHHRSSFLTPPGSPSSSSADAT